MVASEPQEFWWLHRESSAALISKIQLQPSSASKVALFTAFALLEGEARSEVKAYSSSGGTFPTGVVLPFAAVLDL